LLALLGFLLAFGTVVKWNLRVWREKRFFEHLRDLNVTEIARLNGEFEGLDEGNEFADRTHPYSSDLDIYGAHSLWQLINRTTTSFGRNILSGWLNNAGTRAEIAERQAALAELHGEIDWRQEMEATGKMFEDPGESADSLESWMQEKPFISANPYYPKLPLILGSLFLLSLTALIMGFIPWYVTVGQLALHMYINHRLSKPTEEIYKACDERTKVLKAYAALIERIEGKSFNANLLQGLQKGLQTSGKPAFAEIAALARILINLEVRLNGLPYFILNNSVFWDIIWIGRLESWKKAHGAAIMQWFTVIGKIEALNSLAGLHFAQDEWVFPEISESDLEVIGEELGHPMLAIDNRVCNPVDLPESGRVWLVTGSNMSGKSTYLRTVGINAVLALTGAPVCARSLRISPLQILTSMRTLDSLEESTSSFYAELKRLQLVIQTVEKRSDVLFLLDEILKGTNSRDRHAGARALIHQLQVSGGAGIVSTHDLELVDLDQELPGKVINYSFNCGITTDGQLDFDYTLTDGVCQSMNATELMRMMGIKM
ncbi:MAG: DNA mismatch repair protein MutS, partial [Bacteroidota bacterium]